MSKRKNTAKKLSIYLLLIPVYPCLAAIFAALIKRGNMQLLEPAGYIANIQSRLLWGAIVLAVIIGSLVIGSFFFVIFRYREDRHTKYEPGWTGGKKLQFAIWVIPLIVIIMISGILWDSAHLVDPYKPINANVRPVTIQVVALRYKWLFIYPNERIATVNMIEIPVGTPVNFQLTADAPMNSFWIPRLSGQVYAMTGMITQLHIEADKSGIYNGSPAEMSGADFAGMNFTVKAVSPEEYASWKDNASSSAAHAIDYSAYTQLAKPSSYNPPAIYSLADPKLFKIIVMQFMVQDSETTTLLRGNAL